MTTVYDAAKEKMNLKKTSKSKEVRQSARRHPEDHRLPMPESVAREKPTKNSLSAYMIKPNNVHFETQEREEKIVVLLRRHMITNLGWGSVALLLTLLPLILIFLPIFGEFPVRFQIFFVVMWYLFVVAFVFEHFLSWYYNVFIITDERIVDVDFHSLLYKEVSQAKIDNIQDVTFVMGGLGRAFFNFGTVFIQTAGEKREFDFEDVPHPNKVAKILNELILEEEQEKHEGRVR